MKESLRSISEYQEHPFVGARYERVGQFQPAQAFEVMVPEIVNQAEQTTIDPMFADYGGGFSGTQSVQQGALQGSESADWGAAEHASPTPDSEQIRELLEEERAKGFAEGQSEAQSTFDAQMALVRDQVNTLVDQLGTKVQEEIGRIERQAIGLAILISRRIIGEAVEINPEYLLPVVREALGYVGGAEVHRVRISPADLEFVEIERIRERFDGSWSFVGDPAIVSGCVIETNAGEVDYRLDAAWDRLKDNVLRSVTA